MVVIASVLVLGGVVFFSVHALADKYLAKSESTEQKETTCGKQGRTLSVVIENNKVIPQHTYAQRCDVLTVTNKDDKKRKMAFGVHDHHKTYNGKTEDDLTKDESITVELNEVGSFKFHDHFDDDVKGTFTVD